MLERLVRNWPLKGLAVGLAFAIWVAVTGENRIVRDVAVPLDVAMGPEHILASSLPSSIQVRVKGPESLVRRIDPLALSFVVDLRSAPPGERVVVLSPADLAGLPQDVEVTQVEPERLALKVARRLRLRVPIEPTYAGTPAEGYAKYEGRAIPDRAEVEGPEDVLADPAPLGTDPIRLEGRTESFTTEVGAVPHDPAIRVLDPKPVTVRTRIDRAPVDKAFSVPVVLAGKSALAKPTPSSVRVTLSGPPAAIAGIDATQLSVLGVLSEGQADRRGTHRVPVRVDLTGVPSDVREKIRVEKLSHDHVQVRITGREPAS